MVSKKRLTHPCTTWSAASAEFECFNRPPREDLAVVFTKRSSSFLLVPCDQCQSKASVGSLTSSSTLSAGSFYQQDDDYDLDDGLELDLPDYLDFEQLLDS
jgi:hypothetical protein